MTIFYFTGTGNSLFAARKIADATGAALISIPSVFAEQQTYADDCIGFVYPQYAIGLPKMVRAFILNNTFKADYIFAIDLYAFFHGNALGEIAGLIPLNYGAYLKTPNNFIFAVSPPKNPGVMLSKAENRLAEIISDISRRKNKPIKMRKGVGNATKYFGKTKFMVTEACTKCGTCARVCPAGNIEVTGGVIFGNKCENCFSCVNLCSEHAIYSTKAMLKRRQYHNPFVSAADIAEANSTIKGAVSSEAAL
jgi:ferredoxin